MRKPAFCIIYENKGADHCLCFRHIDSTIPLLLNQKFQASSYLLCVQPGMCRTWSETWKILFSHETAHVLRQHTLVNSSNPLHLTLAVVHFVLIFRKSKGAVCTPRKHFLTLVLAGLLTPTPLQLLTFLLASHQKSPFHSCKHMIPLN